MPWCASDINKKKKKNIKICSNYAVEWHFWPQGTIFPCPSSSDSVPDTSPPPTDSVPDGDQMSSPESKSMDQKFCEKPCCDIVGLSFLMWIRDFLKTQKLVFEEWAFIALDSMSVICPIWADWFLTLQMPEFDYHGMWHYNNYSTFQVLEYTYM